MNLNERFLQLALGGSEWVLWLLVGLSLASVAVIVDRWWAYRAVERRQARVARRLLDGERPAWTEIDALCRTEPTPATRMLLRTVDAIVAGTRHPEMVVQTGAKAEKIRLERNLGWLGTVGANAPFIGLLGTVLEILRVFDLLGQQGVTSARDAASIMTGISEALVATGVGLLVAIPATVAYNTFVRRVGRLLGEAEEIAAIGLEFPSDRGED